MILANCDEINFVRANENVFICNNWSEAHISSERNKNQTNPNEKKRRKKTQKFTTHGKAMKEKQNTGRTVCKYDVGVCTGEKKQAAAAAKW